MVESVHGMIVDVRCCLGYLPMTILAVRCCLGYLPMTILAVGCCLGYLPMTILAVQKILTHSSYGEHPRFRSLYLHYFVSACFLSLYLHYFVGVAVSK